MIKIKDKVSIIMPVYNKERYILNTLESIKEQTYTNYEVIIINDGSIDNSFSIINSYTKKNNNLNIKIINQKNNGVSYARNVGIKNSTGKYLFFMDGDDILYKNCIESLVQNIEKNNADMSICGYYVYENNKIVNESKLTNKKNYSSIDFLDMFINWHIHIYMGNALYIRQILINNKICFNNKYKYNEDQIFIYNYLINCKCVTYDPVKNFAYIRSTDSVTMKANEERFTDVQIFIDFYNELKEKKNFNYNKILNILKCNKIPFSIYTACHNLISLNFEFKELKIVISNNLQIYKFINDYSAKNGIKKYIKIKTLQFSPRLFYFLVKNSLF